MVLTLRKYFWVLHLTTIATCSYFAAQTTTTFLATQIEGKIAAPVHRTTAKESEGRRYFEEGEFETIASRNIFNSAQVEVVAGGAGLEGDGSVILDPNAPAVKSALPLKLLGVLVIGEGKDRRSSAIISSGRGGEGDVDIYYPEDPKKPISPRVVLIQVGKKRIEFVNSGRLEYIEMEEAGTGISLFRRAEEVHGEGTGSLGGEEAVASAAAEGVAGEGGQFVIDQREIDDALGNLDKLYTEVRIVPNFKGGQPAGLKVLSIKPGSLFAKLGILRGDILEKINGIDLDVRKGMEIFGQLKDQKSLTVDLVREGKTKTIEYDIR
ncbi:MAG: type II secretion system protein GspC [bacterium]|nr:type II secretion system protein GspC [bacterium]